MLVSSAGCCGWSLMMMVRWRKYWIGCGIRRLASARFDELVEIAVEHLLRGGDFNVGTQILDAELSST